MRAKLINEDMRFNDEGNNKAITSWIQSYVTKDYNDYTIEVEEPFSITVSGIDKDKLQYLFNKYRVHYKVKDEDTIKSQN